ncbi:hypothetical protein GCM10020331_077810 [Ectobacillus funiculus]
MRKKTILPLVIAKSRFIFFIIRSVKETEKELKDTEPVIQFFYLARRGKGFSYKFSILDVGLKF